MPSFFKSPFKGKERDDSPSNENVDAKPGFWKSLNYKLLAALALPVLLETLDYTVVASAQPHIASVFNAVELQSFIGTAYLLAAASFLPFFATLADVYSRHLGLQISLFFVLVGSSVCTGAVNMPMLIAGRGLAGIGAAGLQTIVRTIISDLILPDGTNPHQTAFFILMGLSYTIGPIAGSFLVTASIRLVFVINLPSCVLAMILCFLFLRGQTKRGHVYEEIPTLAKTQETWSSKLLLLDWIGTFLFLSGGTLALLSLNWGPVTGWTSGKVILTGLSGLILFGGCITWEVVLQRQQINSYATPYTYGVRRAQPMLPLALFHSYDFSVVLYGCFVNGIIMSVMFFFLEIFMIVVAGVSLKEAGFSLIFFAPGMIIGISLSIRLIRIFGRPIYPIVLGAVLSTISLPMIIMGMEGNKVLLDIAMIFTGLGVGFPTVPLIMQGIRTQPDHKAAVSHMALFSQTLGGATGLAQCFSVMNDKVVAFVNDEIATGKITGSDLAALTEVSQNGGLTSVTTIASLPAVVQEIIRGAYADGIRWSFISLIPYTAVFIVASLFLSRVSMRPPPAQAPEDNVELTRRISEDSEHDDPPNPSTQSLLYERPVSES
ncbi:major facilitator superfamily domain-containing protein [Hygrophoropsis aurantiaca]|uniref:Major facilitator superfamily domain-containing protein n=1 Tax=Hygrophoropsis aurantiaca TaxID=72124 RepID=A0ACB8AE05_9AGAM|nr:major facilitator superfamily domain-containing protein [Hygrophoropsis aurantiaca]